MATKVCTMCDREKPLTDFWKATKGAQGRQAQCKNCQREYRQKRHNDNPNLWRESKLRREYNLTLDDYFTLFALQDNKCAICGREANEDGRSLAVDHDHDTNRVREFSALVVIEE
jgi:recombination endonuclease VII